MMSGFMYNIVGFTSGSIAVSSRAAAAEAGEGGTTWSAAHESNRNKVSMFLRRMMQRAAPDIVCATL